MANWLILTSWVLYALFAGADCPAVVGPPDGEAEWQYMEYSHGIRLDFDGWQWGGLLVYVTDTEYAEAGNWTNVSIAYRDSDDETFFIGSAMIPPGGGVVTVPGPGERPWDRAILQGGTIFGFAVDAVQTVRPQYRSGLPVVGK